MATSEPKETKETVKVYGTAERIVNEEKNSFYYKLTLNSKYLMEDFINVNIAKLSIVDLKRDDGKLSVIPNEYPHNQGKHFSHANIMLFGDSLLSYFQSRNLSESNSEPVNLFLNPASGSKEKFVVSIYDPDNKSIKGCGMAWRNEHINLGTCIKDKKFENYSLNINKKELFGYIKTHFEDIKNVYLTVSKPNDKGHSSVTISNSKDFPSNTLFVVKLNKHQLLSLPVSESGNIHFYLSQHKERSIKNDLSDYYAFKLINDTKNYIGKAWTEENFSKYMISLSESKENKVSEEVKKTDPIKVNDFVSFSISDDYYLKTKFRSEKEHQVYGIVNSVGQNSVTVTMAGSNTVLKLDTNKVSPSTEEQFKNFEALYNKIKEEVSVNTTKKLKKEESKTASQEQNTSMGMSSSNKSTGKENDNNPNLPFD